MAQGNSTGSALAGLFSVDGMLELHKKLANENNPNTVRRLETRIATTDRQIDRLVYDLYDLTSDEIDIVEQNTATG